MLGKKQTLNILSKAIKEAGLLGLSTEVHLIGAMERTTRSAPDIGPHEVSNIASGEIYGRLTNRQGRYAEFSTSSGNSNAIRAAILGTGLAVEQVDRCSYLPRLQPQPRTLPEEQLAMQECSDPGSDEELRKAAFRKIARAERDLGWQIGGRFSTFGIEVGVANSKELRRYFATRWAVFSMRALDPSRNLTIYADRIASSPEELDFKGAINEARALATQMNNLKKCNLFTLGGRRNTRNAGRICNAVLGPYAMRDILDKMSYAVLNGYSVEIGESPLTRRRLGRMVTGEKFTLADNSGHQNVLSWPFDFEGVTRQVVPLITEGRFTGATYDGMTARKAGRSTTGHSLFDLGTGYPSSLVMEGGSETLESLLKKSRGVTVFINHCHYSALTYEGEFMYSAVVPGAVVYKDGNPVGVSGPLRIRFRPLDAFRSIWGLTAAMPLGNSDETYGIPLPISFSLPGVGLREIRFGPY